MASRRASQSADGSGSRQSSSPKSRGKLIVKDAVEKHGRMMLKEVLMEAMVEAIEEADRYEREQSERDSSDEKTVGRTKSTESEQSSDSSSSKLSWIVPLGIAVAAVYLWRKQMSGEDGVQKSITEWKDDEGSSEGESGKSALSDDDDSGYGTAGDSGMQSPEGVDDDESGRADTDSDDDETTETTETA